MSNLLLSASAITKKFGGITALNKVSLELEEEKIYGLIGPNGSGKTTLVNVITGFLKANEGEVLFSNEKITGLAPHVIAQRGISRTFQTPRVFGDLSVKENIFLGTRRSSIAEKDLVEVLETMEVSKMMNVKAAKLGHGQRKQLELARAVYQDPKLLVLDEPLAGVDPSSVRSMIGFIRDINERLKKPMLIIEHNLDELVKISNFIFVLDHGLKIAEGEPDSVMKSVHVLEAYFGG
jgi:branched-chain amino acid transport system ATP-binding protein